MRLLIHTCGFNLGVIIHKLFGKGTPRVLHYLFAGYLTRFSAHFTGLLRIIVATIFFGTIPLGFPSMWKENRLTA